MPRQVAAALLQRIVETHGMDVAHGLAEPAGSLTVTRDIEFRLREAA
jgi:hypothetical protein